MSTQHDEEVNPAEINNPQPISTTSSTNKRNEIDVVEAMSILSSRNTTNGQTGMMCEVCQSPSPNSGDGGAETKEMGQTVPLWNQCEDDACPKINHSRKKKGGNDNHDFDSRKSSSPMEELEKYNAQVIKEEEKIKSLQGEKRIRDENIRKEIEGMTVGEICSTILEAQRERVVTYKTFDRGLETVLKTRNISAYPAICAKTTASFVVLSDSINIMKLVLVEQKKRPRIASLLTELQTHERDKLNNTAALHLEKIRENDLIRTDRVVEDGTRGLLQEGVLCLTKKLALCVEHINEVLEELRYCAVEEE